MRWDETAPSRAELEREAYEERMQNTYEDRLLEFSRLNDLDPEDVGTVLAYEEWFEEEQQQ